MEEKGMLDEENGEEGNERKVYEKERKGEIGMIENGKRGRRK
jgi:hypothetical protein